MLSFRENTPKRFSFAWLPKSHDLHPCDFFLWGDVDGFLQKMDHVPKNDIELRRAILQAHLSIGKDQLEMACLSVNDR